MEQSQPSATIKMPPANGEAMVTRTRIRGWGGHCSPASPFKDLSFRSNEIDLAVQTDSSG